MIDFVAKTQDKTKYYKIEDVAKSLNITTGTVLFFCGRFIVEPDRDSKSGKALKKFDLGFNFFSWRRDTKEVVPDFIRYIGTTGSNYGK